MEGLWLYGDEIALKCSNFLSSDQAYDGLHRTRGQWKGWRNRCEGRGGVQHREGPSGATAAAQNHGVLWEEREAGWAPEKDVSLPEYTFLV